MNVVQLSTPQFQRIEDVMDACDRLNHTWEQRQAHFRGGAAAFGNEAKQVGQEITGVIEDRIDYLSDCIEDAFDWGVPEDHTTACLRQLLPTDCLAHATLYIQKRKKR